MDELNERLDVFRWEAPEALLTILDHIGKVGEILIGNPVDTPDKIVGILGKMIGDRWQDRMEPVPRSGTAEVLALRCEFFKDCDILL
jgi:hypothetical protein